MPDSSDLDLLVEIPEDLSTPLSRLAAFRRMAPTIEELERDLVTLLGRSPDATTTSIVPVTAFELRFGIHKGGEPDLYIASPFTPLIGSRTPTSFPRNSALTLDRCSAGIAAIKNAQEFRNRFLAITPDGLKPKLSSDDGPDPVPKAMMRAAALLRFYTECLADDSRTDTVLGLDHLSDLIRARSRQHDAYEQLYRWFSIRRNARGVRSPLTPDDAVLLWEILAVEAESVLKKRESDVGPAAASQSHSVTSPSDLVDGISRPHASNVRAFLHEYRTAPFGGRTAELATLHAWLQDGRAPAALMLAEGGRGKSALLVHWLDEVIANGVFDVILVPVSLRFDTAHATAVVRVVTGRIDRLTLDRRPIPTDDPLVGLDDFKQVLRRDWPGQRPLLVVIDGLDEAIGWRGAQLLPDTLGSRIKALVSARGSSSGRSHWEAELGWTAAPLHSVPPLNPAAIERLLAAVDGSLVGLDKALLDRFYAVTEGDPLSVRLQLSLLGEMREGTAAARIEQLLDESKHDQPLNSFMDRWWAEQRKLWKDEPPDRIGAAQAVLNLLACALGPLGLPDLCALTGWDSERVREALDKLVRLVIRDGDRYVLSHSRLRDYFVDRLREADQYERERRKYINFGNTRLIELSSSLDDSDSFRRRFGYVLRHLALHFAADAPADLFKLISGPWLEGRRRLDGEEGLYGGFYADVSQVESLATADEHLHQRCRALLVKASITSLSSNVPPWLMRRLVETRLWPLSRALMITDRLTDDDDHASALAVLAGVADHDEQQSIVDRSLSLPSRPRSRALARMWPDLHAAQRERAFTAIIDAAVLVRGNSTIALDAFARNLPPDFLRRLLDAARAVDDVRTRLRATIDIMVGADSLGVSERRQILEQCENDVARVSDIKQRAYCRCEIAGAVVDFAPEQRARLIRLAWDDIRELDANDDEVSHLLAVIADDIAGADDQTRQEVVATLWKTINESARPWQPITYLGPRLAKLGFASDVFDKSEAIQLDEHSRAILLASLVPTAPALTRRILERLKTFKRREWCLEALSYQVDSLSSDQREQYIEEAIDWVARHQGRSSLVGHIAQKLVVDDRDAPKVLAAARAIRDPAERAQRLWSCVHLVAEEQRDAVVLEVLQDASELEYEPRMRLLSQMARVIRTDPRLLTAALDVSRKLGDEHLIASAFDHFVVRLARSDNSRKVETLAERALTTFPHHPSWSADTLVRLVKSLPAGERSALWELAREATDALTDTFDRALLSVELAIHAPDGRSGVLNSTALSQVEGLKIPYQRLYATIRSLRLLSAVERQSSLDEVVASVSTGTSLREQFSLLCALLPQLTTAEQHYILSLRSVVDRVLRRKGAADNESAGELVSIADAFYIDELAAYLDVEDVRDEAGRCPSSAVSSIAAIGYRLAELGEQHEALSVLRRAESAESRAVGISRVLGFFPKEARPPLLNEIRQNLAETSERSGETESYIIDYLDESDRADWIQRGLENALKVSRRQRSRATMRRLAEHAARYLSDRALAACLSGLIEKVAPQRREDLVQDLDALMPILARVGGDATVESMASTLLDVVAWFP